MYIDYSVWLQSYNITYWRLGWFVFHDGYFIWEVKRIWSSFGQRLDTIYWANGILLSGKWNYFHQVATGSTNKCDGHKSLQNFTKSYHSCHPQRQVLQGASGYDEETFLSTTFRECAMIWNQYLSKANWQIRGQLHCRVASIIAIL